jgi:hypothetical protein
MTLAVSRLRAAAMKAMIRPVSAGRMAIAWEDARG